MGAAAPEQEGSVLLSSAVRDPDEPRPRWNWPRSSLSWARSTQEEGTGRSWWRPTPASTHELQLLLGVQHLCGQCWCLGHQGLCLRLWWEWRWLGLRGWRLGGRRRRLVVLCVV